MTDLGLNNDFESNFQFLSTSGAFFEFFPRNFWKMHFSNALKCKPRNSEGRKKQHRSVGVKVLKMLSEHRCCILETFLCLSQANLLGEEKKTSLLEKIFQNTENPTVLVWKVYTWHLQAF